ncbi:tRNA (adenosine(37)-N6)-dimethylallyltransferase MiaA [Candidatus Peregrinibacteria bacterium RIFOXYC2_FULL_33_13]|nr:MAG: tRNA dimethylallyltransferase [Candidatus Peregrinibacteria bacterium GW2011_GWA2_33_10]KKP39010.1 MAG: tRNA delta(2)-isopentenylpyrophosphate transferase, tRNA dimethylallyltransferase [Candidatus Peregrinibacteria bacterium GW2011_GWC2_33_13]OGJ49681.1 MAG: tRNA (adenosine(37)-N6)-dimethylallyltransferase MiaA [Candidatus Peregrinibacteria bacterium RIFOXYA2_FULL_33_7]OGJ53774.1 MAG: tRNA (adenosine(37)-N6)-dimethylallyltransferase MiaA [Candidatus Peregrinibacteria bacterium RIFOXYC2_
MLHPSLKSLIDNFLNEESEKPSLIVIVGPTCSGKTSLSLELAKIYDIEIISADSRQIYREMDIGTDKIPQEIRSKISHHLIDIAWPHEVITLSEYKRLAEKAIQQIVWKRKMPVLIGGTGLYTTAITENYQIPQTGPNFALRYELIEELNNHGQDYMYEKLKELDPASAQNIDPRNHRYLLRALEINLETGKNKQNDKGNSKYHILKIGLECERDLLYQKINERVLKQVESGLITETQQLLHKYSEKLPSMSSLGYPQIAKYLKGELSIEEAIDLLQKETRNYAKRQLTWYRRDKEINWFQNSSDQ